ncbi:hypothetical protein SAMN05421780_101110 [Flexibacter flexilis DSM 6793]|uniref:Uncharacterized protein n=1 Tax=Flexibacter flexilis DSM 6793 TaxID=927664 RepID=A0A1I1DBJ4_9BACT|nr:hypothetical protein [Flexibacter flexilis]SFB72399.1 hypothetical protein SAMN05421780_101110 [Flexibacter flexilis DSM 6793]
MNKFFESLYAYIDSVLEDGLIYYSTPINQERGILGGMVYCIVDGVKNYNLGKEVEKKLDDFQIEIEDEYVSMYALTKLLPVNRRIKYIFQKGQPIKAEVYSTQMIIDDFINDLKNGYSYKGFVRVEAEFQYIIQDKNLKLSGNIIKTNSDLTTVNSDKIYDDNLELLYYSLDGKIDKFHFVFENDCLSIFSKPAFPEYNFLDLNETINMELDENNKDEVFSFLESLNEHKIAKAIEVLKTKPEWYARAEARYLNFIKTRLKNPEAGLEQLADIKVITQLDVSLMMGKDIDKNFISLSYLDDSQTCFIVDYLGAMVRNAFHSEDLIAEMKILVEDDDDRVREIHKKYSDILDKWIKNEIEFYNGGWFGKINKKLFDMYVEKLLFDHTDFSSANKSLVMNEFMFFLENKPESSLLIDIFQSTCPNLGCMFWILPNIPDTIWGDVKPYFPKSVLSFQRSASIKIGDDGQWNDITSEH